MFGRAKSYTNADIEDMAMLLREIDVSAENEAHLIVEGMLAWAQNDPSNKKK